MKWYAKLLVLLSLLPLKVEAQKTVYDWDSAHFNFNNPMVGDYLTSNKYMADMGWTCVRFYDNSREKIVDSLSRLINFYPNHYFTVEIHTDCRATAEYNHDLTQRIADSAQAYIKKGLNDTSRLSTAIGKGEDELLITKCNCGLSDKEKICTEAEHQQNRRLVLKVVGRRDPNSWIDSTDLLDGVHIGDRIHIWTLWLDLSGSPRHSVYYDSAVLIINNHPTLVFQLENHADCRYSKEYSINYSQRRADSTLARLLPFLKDARQLPVSLGLGEDELYLPKCKCDLSDTQHLCTEAEHQRNRRTVLKVIGIRTD